MFDDRRVIDTILDSGTVKYMGNQANKKTKQIFLKKFKMEQREYVITVAQPCKIFAYL